MKSNIQHISSSDEDYKQGVENDYSYAYTTARIALYDDLQSTPRITDIQPAPTDNFIMDIATTTYEQAKLAGGHIPFSIIKEVSENFIHAQFSEIIVSILDEGNTIRFADQGPGIADKEKAQLPGFSSAIEPMKHYIRGVGSGLPIVKDYFDGKKGKVIIDDNIKAGAVVTISLKDQYTSVSTQATPSTSQKLSLTPLIPLLSEKEKEFLPLFLSEGMLGVTELSSLTNTPLSSTYNALKKMEESGLVEKGAEKKRILTEFGRSVAHSLQ